MKRSAAIVQPHRAASGFTLIELMIVVIILAALAAMVIPRLVDRSDEAKSKIAAADIRIHIDTALKLYRLDTGDYPAGDQGLDALMAATGKGPYLERPPLDPWRRPYRYHCPGTHNPRSFDLYSLGKDGRENTDDDINNWQ
jgi:general secretion pathway protein G